MSKRNFSRREDIDIVRQAKENLTRDPDNNTFNRAELVAEIRRIKPLDVEAISWKEAERIVKDQERTAKTPPNGSLWLPGFDPVPYEPEQLLSDDSGRTVEKDFATAQYVSTQLQRAEENYQKVRIALQRKRAETDAFTTWSADQAIAGRPNNENTFGNCMRETGLWSQQSVTGDDEDDDDGE